MGKLLDKVVHEAQAKGRHTRAPETREAALQPKRAANAVFLATFQICAHAEPGTAGPAFKYRKPEQTVIAIARSAQEIAQVIAENLDLVPGEFVEVTQQRQLEPTRKVFEAKR